MRGARICAQSVRVRWVDRVDTVIVDVDGTLVDSNYQHALAWYRAFRRFEITLPVWTIHRAIGMGGDQLVTDLTDDRVERNHGDGLRAAWTEEFEPMLTEIQALPGVEGLLRAIKDRGLSVVLASSGKEKHVSAFLDLFDGRSLADAWTTSDDAERSKPAPDLVEVAMAKVSGRRAVMVGDSTWDCVAAKRAGLPSLAVRTGGFSADELYHAGGEQVVDSLDELRDLITATD
jgi:HAD superfamily hydrolase (TIGR01549 family)